MLLNDQIGDCAIACPLHQIQTWEFNDGRSFSPTDQMALQGYELVGHYNPNDPNSDQGCVLLDVLKTWRSVGFSGHKIGAYMSVTPTDHHMVTAGVYLFGGLTIGVSLPAAIEGAKEWKAPSRAHRHGQWAPGSWGGHCVQIVDFDAHWLYVVTWGEILRMSYAFLDAYCDEIYAVLSGDWFGPDFKAPNGFDLHTLTADLSALH
jgi:hypothetical protein